MDKFGEIEDFNTESEMFVLFNSDWWRWDYFHQIITASLN
jgi:hypothetical protein